MNNITERVLLAMSGGVDSSVAGHLLIEQGYEVIGATLRLHPAITEQTFSDARAAAERMGIEHHIVDESEAFDHHVVRKFVSEYHVGRTPNPCTYCNRHIKFGRLLDTADRLGCQYIATGHYVGIEHSADGPIVKKGADHHKDQSYFLFSVTREQFSRVLFPLGGLSKSQVRSLAANIGLPVADKPDSLEICFVPDNDYGRFLREHISDFRCGNFLDSNGNIIGRHQGIENYTLGQRKGLPCGTERRYVTDIDSDTADIRLGSAEDLLRSEFFVSDLNWLDSAPLSIFRGTVKVRSANAPRGCTLYPLDGNCARVELESSHKSVTPGQAAVFYYGDRMMGGGWIERKGRL